ncbi:hypothetical protein IFM89_036337 [Coptis chinensis]|uniref:AT-hook motif nuclear-localized protein n=1 Tax=Coptis chinensis TaxID=261450 RepID=A0A835IGJ8_9MAGN|nr:hypothetical protein IFM89_036337 [Coptis chinensis]
MENTQQTTTFTSTNTTASTTIFTPTPATKPEPIQAMPISFGSSAITSFSLTDQTNPINNNGSCTTTSSIIKPDCGLNMVSSEPVKRKRGRPRKYHGPDGGVVLALSPLSSEAPNSKNGPNVSSYKPRNRKRPTKKQQLDPFGSAGRGFMANVIVVKAGEDIASKIMAFSQQGPHTVCVLSANGAVCNVTLRQPAMYGGTVSYEGRFEIISLSGSFLLMESGGTRSRSGGMSVSLAGSDGRILGGGVAGMLIAATPVQVVIGSFGAEENPMSELSLREPLPAPAPYMMSFGMPVAAVPPPFPSTYSGSSDETGSPINFSSRACNDTEQSNQATYTYSSIGHASTHSSNPQRQEFFPKFLPN